MIIVVMMLMMMMMGVCIPLRLSSICITGGRTVLCSPV